jgi:hypothetical protein
MDRLAEVPKRHLAKLVEITERLGYPDEARTLGGYL